MKTTNNGRGQNPNACPDQLGRLRRRVHVAMFVLLLSIFGAPAAAAEPLTAEKRADIERLLEITGTVALAKQMAAVSAAQIVDVVRKVRPDIPQRALDVIPAEVQYVFEANMDSFVEAVIPVYHKHYTGKEIKELLRFYSTDLGRKTIQVMPALMNDSMRVGQQWGESLGPAIEQRINARLKDEGFIL